MGEGCPASDVLLFLTGTVIQKTLNPTGGSKFKELEPLAESLSHSLSPLSLLNITALYNGGSQSEGPGQWPHHPN